MNRRLRIGIVMFAVFSVIAVAATLRISNIETQPIDKDEVYSYLGAQGWLLHGKASFGPTAYPYNRALLHNWLYSRVLATSGDALPSGRWFSLVCGLLVLVAYAGVARRVSSWPVVVAGMALLAVSKWENYHAISARMYVFLQLCFIVHVWFALRLLDRRTLPGWVGFGLTSAACATIHSLYWITAPFLALGFAIASRRFRPVLLAVVLLVLGTGLGATLDLAPTTDIPREDYGRWSVAAGNPIENIGFAFMRLIHERAPWIPLLAIMGGLYAWSRSNARLGFLAITVFGSSMAVNVGSALHMPRYYLHLFPLFICLGLAAAERLWKDAREGADTIGAWTAAPLETVNAILGKAGLSFNLKWAAIAVGALAMMAGLGADVLLGKPFSPGADQLMIAGAGMALIVAAAISTRWNRLQGWANGTLRVGLVAAVLLALPSWWAQVGRYHAPPYQRQMLDTLRDELRSGDRLLTTEHLIPFVQLGWSPMGFLSQKIRNEQYMTYATADDVVTGISFVDSADKLDAWLSDGRRTFIVVDNDFYLHVEPKLRERISALPVIYESDPEQSERSDPHPEWSGQTYRCKVHLWDGRGR